MSVKKMVLGLAMVGAMCWGGRAMALATPELDATVVVEITCQISNALLGWDETAGMVYSGANALDTIAERGYDVQWALGNLLPGTTYYSHDGASKELTLVLKNFGGAALDITAVVACPNWTRGAPGNNQYQLMYTCDLVDSTNPAATNFPANDGYIYGNANAAENELAIGAQLFLTLALQTPTSVSAAGIGAQIITVTLTGVVDS